MAFNSVFTEQKAWHSVNIVNETIHSSFLSGNSTLSKNLKIEREKKIKKENKWNENNKIYKVRLLPKPF